MMHTWMHTLVGDCMDCSPMPHLTYDFCVGSSYLMTRSITKAHHSGVRTKALPCQCYRHTSIHRARCRKHICYFQDVCDFWEHSTKINKKKYQDHCAKRRSFLSFSNTKLQPQHSENIVRNGLKNCTLMIGIIIMDYCYMRFMLTALSNSLFHHKLRNISLLHSLYSLTHIIQETWQCHETRFSSDDCIISLKTSCFRKLVWWVHYDIF